MYTLVSAAVLACDVVRHPHAARLADTLDRVLALTLQESCGLRSPADGAVRARVLEACTGPASPAPDLGAALGAQELEQSPAALALRLEGSLLGSLADLHALVLREEPVRSLPPEGTQVVLDALTAAWAGSAATLADVRALTDPWEHALDPVPPALPERPWTAALRELLDDVPRRTTAQWRASANRTRVPGRSLRWSEALHVSARAAWGSGRLHDVARAQLAGARALAVTHTGVSPYSSARVLTAAVQAVCTQDLLASGVRDALWADWEAGSAAG